MRLSLARRPTPGQPPAAPVAPGTHPGPDPDRTFVQALLAGDAVAAERFVREHGPRMLAVARRILGDREEARDVVHDAFVGALRSLDGFRGDARLATWLHRIVVHAALGRLRGAKRRPEVALDPWGDMPEDGSATLEPTPPLRFAQEADVARAETRRRVRACVSRLPAPARLILVLRDIEGFDADETARLLGITRNAVNIRLHRARQALMRMLDDAR